MVFLAIAFLLLLLIPLFLPNRKYWNAPDSVLGHLLFSFSFLLHQREEKMAWESHVAASVLWLPDLYL